MVPAALHRLTVRKEDKIMKKIFGSLMLASLLAVAASIFLFGGEAKADDSKIGKGATDYQKLFDFDDFISDEKEAEFESRLQALSDKYGADVVAVFDIDRPARPEYNIPDELEATELYAIDFYNEPFSDGGRYSDDGIIFMFTMADRSVSIQSVDVIGDVVTFDDRESILDDMMTDFHNNNFDAVLDIYINEVEELFEGYGSRVVRQWIFRCVIFLVIGLIIGLIRVSVLKGQLKSVAIKTEASDYIVPGSFNLRNSRDFFLYKTVSRVRRQSSSGGGSSHSSGGRSFSGSSRHV